MAASRDDPPPDVVRLVREAVDLGQYELGHQHLDSLPARYRSSPAFVVERFRICGSRDDPLWFLPPSEEKFVERLEDVNLRTLTRLEGIGRKWTC